MVLACKIGKYGSSEKAFAEEMIEHLCELGSSNDLILFDRGYPSREFIQFLDGKKYQIPYACEYCIFESRY